MMFWAYMVGGMVGIVLGVVASTLGAGFLFAEDPRKMILSNAQATLAIVIGTIIATGGGVATTHAWNLRSTAETRAMLAEVDNQRLQSQRDRIARQVILDIEYNDGVLNEPRFLETDPEKLKEYFVFVSLATESVNEIITSGLFLGPDERRVLTEARKLREWSRLYETMADQFNSSMARNADNPQMIATYRTAARNAESVEHIRRISNELSDAIAAWQKTLDPEGQNSTKEAASP